jgi:signal peptidase I
MISKAHLQSACCDLVAYVARVSGKVQLKVAGVSMVPALWPGDIITVRSCDPQEVGPDSIIVFRQNQRLIVHRLMHREGDRIVTRGDASPGVDEPITAAEIVGCVDTITRNGRPVDPRLDLWQRTIASILRRSEWFTWFFLRLGSRIRRFGVAAAAQHLSISRVPRKLAILFVTFQGK